MIKTFIFLIMISFSITGISQNHSELYIHVDSLITYEIKYVEDSTTGLLPKLEWDSTESVEPHFSTFPSNPYPLIILDGKRIEKSQLNNFEIKEVEKIDIYPKQNSKAIALYGTSAANGAIILQTRKVFNKKE